MSTTGTPCTAVQVEVHAACGAMGRGPLMGPFDAWVWTHVAEGHTTAARLSARDGKESVLLAGNGWMTIEEEALESTIEEAVQSGKGLAEAIVAANAALLDDFVSPFDITVEAYEIAVQENWRTLLEVPSQRITLAMCFAAVEQSPHAAAYVPAIHRDAIAEKHPDLNWPSQAASPTRRAVPGI